MSERRCYLDVGVGEARGVVTLDGRPERLLIWRDGDCEAQRLGARLVTRVRRVERAQAMAFLELCDGPDAVLNVTPEVGRLVEGQAVEVELRSEARAGKGATARLIGLAEGPPRVLAPGPAIEEQLRSFVREAQLILGPVARTMADGAQDEALQTVFALPGGGSLAVEPTRALVAVDVDLGSRVGGEAKRAARTANFAALAATARVLRLKGLGGLVVVDLIGRGHDGPAMIAAARAAFAPDNPGVALGPVSRFGALELTVPRRARGAWDILGDGEGEGSALTQALTVVRALEREAIADGGGRFEAVAATEVADAAGPALEALRARLGARVAVRGNAGLTRTQYEVARL